MKKEQWGFREILTLIIVMLSFIYFAFVLFVPVSATYVSQIITAIVAMIATVFGFHYGSSTSSQKKDEIIAKMQSDANPPVIVANAESVTTKADVVNTNNVETLNTQTTNVKTPE